jgi:hypothetical protein
MPGASTLPPEILDEIIYFATITDPALQWTHIRHISSRYKTLVEAHFQRYWLKSFLISAHHGDPEEDVQNQFDYEYDEMVNLGPDQAPWAPELVRFKLDVPKLLRNDKRVSVRHSLPMLPLVLAAYESGEDVRADKERCIHVRFGLGCRLLNCGYPGGHFVNDTELPKFEYAEDALSFTFNWRAAFTELLREEIMMREVQEELLIQARAKIVADEEEKEKKQLERELSGGSGGIQEVHVDQGPATINPALTVPGVESAEKIEEPFDRGRCAELAKVLGACTHIIQTERRAIVRRHRERMLGYTPKFSRTSRKRQMLRDMFLKPATVPESLKTASTLAIKERTRRRRLGSERWQRAVKKFYHNTTSAGLSTRVEIDDNEDNHPKAWYMPSLIRIILRAEESVVLLLPEWRELNHHELFELYICAGAERPDYRRQWDPLMGSIMEGAVFYDFEHFKKMFKQSIDDKEELFQQVWKWNPNGNTRSLYI